MESILSKLFSKKDPEDVTIRIGTYDNKQRLGDLSDKQLRGIAAYNHKSPRAKKNVRNNSLRVIIPFSAAGGITGHSISGLKGSVKGAVIGASIGGGIVFGADRMHRKHARAAEKILIKRGHKPTQGIIRIPEEE